jgi:2-polyprenyl-3-methyl-5-hydroxy-6-metoxy-1,4-benzoquinol methylase
VSLQREDLVNLALEVTGMTRERWNFLCEEMKSDAKMNLIMKQDWNAKPRDSEGAIREYYRTSDIWFINTFNHGVGALLSMAAGQRGDLVGWCRKFAETLKTPGGRILDYGGGFFKDTWPMATAGYKIDVAEVRGPVTEFLKRFISLAKLENRIGVVEVDSETPIVDMYHGIVCFETLEHVLHPEALTAHLHQHLQTGGLFAFSVTFGAPEHAPYHVASNAPFGDWNVWAAVLTKIGFSPCWEDPTGTSMKIWRSGP